jgi:hypothetical protein
VHADSWAASRHVTDTAVALRRNLLVSRGRRNTSRLLVSSALLVSREETCRRRHVKPAHRPCRQRAHVHVGADVGADVDANTCCTQTVRGLRKDSEKTRKRLGNEPAATPHQVHVSPRPPPAAAPSCRSAAHVCQPLIEPVGRALISGVNHYGPHGRALIEPGGP